ncbi:protein kinase [Acidobacteriota bacterium]
MENKCPDCHSDNTDTAKFCSNCAAPLDSSVSPQPSFTKTIETPVEKLTRGILFAERYEIIEELGKGGMGQVYRVEDKSTREEIALKLIKSKIASDSETIERFRNELTIARKIRHKNICGMYDLGEYCGAHFITMEYVPGQDLGGLIRQSGRLAIPTAISLAKQVCEGLTEAHKLRVVHRDLKPSNIMIDKEGHARIMDFGIARSIEGKGITGAGIMIGTPEYMSPEQVEAKDVDQRSDIYSLGIILYEMTTGQLPFKGETSFSVGIKQKSEIPKDPREINPQIPEALSLLILKCLEKDKQNRYQRAEDVFGELNNIEEGIPTTERVIPRKKTITSKEITVSLSVKKLLIPSLVIFAIIVVGLIIWKPWSPERTVLPTSGKPSLAIVYFENNTGDESLDHWRKALCELLIADLTQSKYIKVMSSDRLIDILNNLDQIEGRGLSSSSLKQVADRGGSTHILRGSFTKAGEQFRMDAILQETPTMEAIGSERIEGTGEESLLSMVDELTRKVKTHFKISEEEIADDIDEDVEKITTSSPEALKLYIEGRKYHLTLDYQKSIELMEQAVTIDPEFALAYRSLAVSHGNLGLRGRRKNYIEKALELADRLPVKERYLIEGDFYSDDEKTYGKAIDAYNRLLELYEDDSTGNHNLALIYSDSGDKDKAIERYEISRENKNLSLIGYGNLASVYREINSYDKARDVLEESLEMYPNRAVPYRDLARHYFMEGKYDLALAEIEKAFALEPKSRQNLHWRAEINVCRDDLVKATENFQQVLKINAPQARYVGSMGLTNLNILQGKFKGTKAIIKPMIELGMMGSVFWVVSETHLRFAYIDLGTENLKEALKDCEDAFEFALKARDLERQMRALHSKGLVYLRMNLLEESRKTSEELKTLTLDYPNPQKMHYFLHLKGSIELKQNNYPEAIRHIEEALALQTRDPNDKRIDYIETLAQVYNASGDIDKAQVEYERITSTKVDLLGRGDVFALTLYKLGTIYEQKGWKGKAIESYEKFLDLWKDADPSFPEVEDARTRLAGLKN